MQKTSRTCSSATGCIYSMCGKRDTVLLLRTIASKRLEGGWERPSWSKFLLWNLHFLCILLVSKGAKRVNGGKCCDGRRGGLVGLVGLVPGLVRNEDVKINEASAGSDAGWYCNWCPPLWIPARESPTNPAASWKGLKYGPENWEMWIWEIWKLTLREKCEKLSW